jgi:hypothetical protein
MNKEKLNFALFANSYLSLLIIVFFAFPFLSWSQRNAGSVKPPQSTQQPTPPASKTTTVNATSAAIQTETVEAFYDSDVDGIDDNLENKLLERFRPYYKFSYSRGSQDQYRPTDVIYYLRCSELNTTGDESGDNTFLQNQQLASSPAEIFLGSFKNKPLGSPMITQQNHKTGYHLNPLENVNGLPGSQPGSHGNSWEEVLAQKNIGLYGHVVPVKLVRPQDYDRKKVLTGNDAGTTYYKIEYWQFFGFNETGIGGAGNHEGDWTTVQLLYNPATDKPEAVFHYAHGKVEFRFFLDEASSAPEFATPPQRQPVEVYKEYRGRNFGKYGDIVALMDNYSHNTLRMLKDPVTKEFSHPFVYIEWGAHEFWPTESGFFPGVPTHNGEGYSYLTGIPLNLGEVELPGTLPGNRGIEAMIVTRFNGYWGSYGGPPPGPSLHYQWTWPASSSIRWLLTSSDLTD